MEDTEMEAVHLISVLTYLRIYTTTKTIYHILTELQRHYNMSDFEINTKNIVMML